MKKKEERTGIRIPETAHAVPSREDIVKVLLELYERNDTAICHLKDGAVACTEIRTFVDSLAASGV